MNETNININADKVLQRKAGRELAEVILKLIEEETSKFTDADNTNSTDAFWEKLFSAAFEKIINIDVSYLISTTDNNSLADIKNFILPMSSDELTKFQKEKIDFGKYGGLTFDKIPLRYLDWLLSTSRKLTTQLARYLCTPSIRMQLDLEEELEFKIQESE